MTDNAFDFSEFPGFWRRQTLTMETTKVVLIVQENCFSTACRSPVPTVSLGTRQNRTGCGLLWSYSPRGIEVWPVSATQVTTLVPGLFPSRQETIHPSKSWVGNHG